MLHALTYWHKKLEIGQVYRNTHNNLVEEKAYLTVCAYARIHNRAPRVNEINFSILADTNLNIWTRHLETPSQPPSRTCLITYIEITI